MTISDWYPLFVTAKNDVTYSKRYYEGQKREPAEACFAMCNDVDGMNDLVVCLTSSAYALQGPYQGGPTRTDPSALIRPMYV